MRRFVVIGRRATASGDFLLGDVAGTSGRLDIALRCVRAALLTSHGVRRDVGVYLVLCGGPQAPRVLRIRGDDVRFLRPDERSLAVLVKKVLAVDAGAGGSGLVEVKPGIAVASGGCDLVAADLGAATPYILEEGGPDIRDVDTGRLRDGAFFLGDHGGFDPDTRAQLVAIGALPLGVGPVSVHAEDAITIVHNELDRRDHRAGD